MFRLNFLHTALVSLACVNAVPVVDLGYAQYEGAVDSQFNITSFRGIRYAASPTGK
jgi:hypothetical protein